MALSPFVIIGVGGSGGKTLRVIHEVLSNTLTSIGWEGGWPKAWQFLHIEVASAPDGIEPGLPFTLPLSDFASLTTPQSTYRAVDGQVSKTKARGLDHYLAWDSWRPYPPDHVPVTISLGAGQFRAIGRVAVLNSLEEVSSRVNHALSEATSADVAELERIQELYGKEDLGTDNIARSPTVLVIASISGGSGSGALLDVCDVVRTHRSSEQTNVNAVVYAPEVFEGEGGKLEPGIAPNAFFALNELLNASWVRGVENLPLSRAVHFSRSRVNPHRDRTGPDSVFIVGRRNASVTLGNTSEIYRVMGRSLAELTLSETQQDSLGAYSSANAAARAAAIQHTIPVAPQLRDVVTPRYTNLYALGFSRLTVGREIFREYAAQRLAREAVVRLRGIFPKPQPGDRRPDEAIIKEIVEKNWPSFLRDSRVNEVGYESNAVIDAILPPGALENLLVGWTRSVQAKLDAGTGNGRLAIDDARQQVRDEIDEALKPDGIYPGYLAQLKERAITWRRGIEGDDVESSIHETLAGLVVREAARFGVRVASSLLDRLSRELKTAADELEAESRQRNQDGNDLLQALLDRKPNEPRNVETEVGGYVDQTLIGTEGYNAIYQLLYAEAVGIAGDLVKSLSSGLLTPLKRGLQDASDVLRQEVEPASGRTSDFSLWPGETNIPDHLRPSRVERTLDDVNKFPEVCLDLVLRSTGAESPWQGTGLAIEEIIEGERLAPQHHAPAPLDYRSRWVPDQERLRRLDERTSVAAVDVHIGLSDLLERARAWVSDTEKAIGRHVHQSLAEYLTDGEVGAAERLARRDRLTGEFKELLRLAQPLVQINTDNLQLAHSIDRPEYELVMSPLNIPADDNALRAELEEIAQGILGQPTRIPVGPQRSGTQVMTTLKQPLHPIALQSVMEPIFTQWDADRLGQNFWSYRRARPLPEWVPLSPAAQAALAKGWVTARLLGYAYTAQNAEDLSWEIRVKTGNPGARAGSWVTLAKSAPRTITPDDALGNVFELVAMTALEVYRAQSLAPLEPFQALVDLGAAPWTEHRIAKWVGSGFGIDSVGNPIAEDAPTAAERKQSLLDGLAAMETAFTAHARMAETSGLSVDALQKFPRIEVARLALSAVEAIRGDLTNAVVLDHGGKV